MPFVKIKTVIYFIKEKRGERIAAVHLNFNCFTLIISKYVFRNSWVTYTSKKLPKIDLRFFGGKRDLLNTFRYSHAVVGD